MPVSVNGRLRPAAGFRRTILPYQAAALITSLAMAPGKNQKIALQFFRGSGAT